MVRPKSKVKRPAKRIANPFTLPTEPTTMASGPRDYIYLFFGPPGVGKTTFINNFGRVLFLSTDRGTRFMEALRVECLDWETFQKVLKALEKPGAEKYDYICIDHVFDFIFFAEMWACKQLGVESLAEAKWGKGWAQYKRAINDYVARIKALNTGLVFVAHEEEKTIKIGKREVDRLQPAMSKSGWTQILPLCDLVGRLSIRAFKSGGKMVNKRILETEPSQLLYAKDRTKRHRPDGLELLDAESFMESFNGQANRKKAGPARRKATRKKSVTRR